MKFTNSDIRRIAMRGAASSQISCKGSPLL